MLQIFLLTLATASALTSPFGSFVARDRRRDEVVLVDRLETLPIGIHVVRDRDGLVRMIARDDLHALQFVDTVERVLVDGELGWTFATARVDGQDYFVIPNDDWDRARLTTFARLTIGRAPRAEERVVVTGEPGDLRARGVRWIFPSVGFETDDGLIPRAAARAITSHAPEAAWVKGDGTWWPVQTLGRVDNLEVYAEGDKYGLAPTLERPRAASPLIGRTVGVFEKGKRLRRTAVVKHALTNGAVVTTRDEVLAPGHFREDNGAFAARLKRSGIFESIGRALLAVPHAVLFGVVEVVTFVRQRYFAYRARRDVRGGPDVEFGPPVTLERGSATKTEVVGKLLRGGSPDQDLPWMAQLLARKFGAATYVKSAAIEPTAWAISHVGRLYAVFNADADPMTLAHEGTHLRNTFAHVVRRRLVARTSVFSAEGFRLMPEAYGNYGGRFRADEVHARAVEVGLLLNAAEAVGATPAARRASLTLAQRKIEHARDFLAAADREVELLREAVLADGGTWSVTQDPDEVILSRPVPRASRDDAEGRRVTLTLQWPAWPWSKAKKLKFALKLLDALARDNAVMAKILSHQEGRLEKLSARVACDEALAGA